jgi:hypothetical protein
VTRFVGHEKPVVALHLEEEPEDRCGEAMGTTWCKVVGMLGWWGGSDEAKSRSDGYTAVRLTVLVFTRLISATVAGVVRIWELRSGRRLAFLDLKTAITAMQVRRSGPAEGQPGSAAPGIRMLGMVVMMAMVRRRQRVKVI